MKRIKIRIVIMLVAVAAVASAFTAKKNYKESSIGTVYYWFDPYTDDYVGPNTFQDQVDLTGCNGPSMNPTCQKGYTSSHLINAGSPGMGHVSGPADVLINMYF